VQSVLKEVVRFSEGSPSIVARSRLCELLLVDQDKLLRRAPWPAVLKEAFWLPVRCSNK
jgi:hypothetical protein